MKKYLPDQLSQKGQVVLVILLVMAVVLTVGLSIASRSVTDVKISQQSQEAARALWVAQAGLEAGWANIQSESGSFDNDSVGFEVTGTGLGEGTDYLYPQKVSANDPATVWLVAHNETTREIDDSDPFNDKITIYWGNEGENASADTAPALEATLIYLDGTVFKQKRYVFDPFTSRVPATNFDNTSGGGLVNGQNFAFSSGEINLNSLAKPYLFRIKILFNQAPQPLAVKASKNLPAQGRCLESLGSVAESGVSRKIKECRLWEVSPAIFDYTLFSGGALQ